MRMTLNIKVDESTLRFELEDNLATVSVIDLAGTQSMSATTNDTEKLAAELTTAADILRRFYSDASGVF